MTATTSVNVTVPDRLAELERMLGDPGDPGNALGHTGVLAADERDEMFAAAEQTLDRYGFNAEFVPTRYGGRLDRLEDLIQAMRSLFRRDPALGLGYGLSSFLSSVNVWAAGSPEQAHRVAAMLLNNERVAAGFHELAHGNDVSRAEFAARPDPAGGWRLTGHKEVITNVRRSRAMVLLARTDEQPGSRSHSQILVDKHDVPAATTTDLPRYLSVGMRGVQLGGIDFRDCPVGPEAVVGRPGAGIETTLRAFQLTRTAFPSMLVGVLDTGLRVTHDFATRRRLYGRTVADLPNVRAILADAYADLLICDSFGMVVARATHLLPTQVSVHASAVKYLAAKRLLDAMHRLSLVLGAHFYLREGRYAIFQKLLRDLAPAGFGHAAPVACLATILPQVPVLARRGWIRPEPASEELFQLGGPVPELAFDRLRVNGGGADALAGTLGTAGDALRAGRGDADPATRRELIRLTAGFQAELAELAGDGARLHPAELRTATSVAALRIPARYSAVLAASACLGVWLSAGGDPAWVHAALGRLAEGLGRRGADQVGPLRERLYAQLAERAAARRSFDHANRPLPG
jgi:alkylation response protein AidB-like acyl-CoA dehydrogenase